MPDVVRRHLRVSKSDLGTQRRLCRECAEVLHGDILPENFLGEQMWESPGEVCVCNCEREGDSEREEGREEMSEKEGEVKRRRVRKREERERNGGKERESKYFGSEKKVSRT